MKLSKFNVIPAAIVASFSLALSAGAAPVKVTLQTTTEDVITGWVTKGNATTLWVSTNEQAPGAPMPRTRIANIVWEDPDDWKEGMKYWTRRDYVKGADAFAKLAKEYEGLAQVEDSIGAKAKYYQGECLRRSGKYAELLDVYDEVRRVSLSDAYKQQIALFNFWGHVGKKMWKPLKLITDRFEIPESEVPSHTVPPTTQPLKKIDAGLMIQVAYMRGIATEMLGREEHKEAVAALDPQVPETQVAVDQAWAHVKESMNDYARVFTLTYMSERRLAQEAMERSMAILKEDPSIKDNYQMQLEAYALASFYKDLFGKGAVPAEFTAFLTEPKPPESTSEEAEEEEETEEEAEEDPAGDAAA